MKHSPNQSSFNNDKFPISLGREPVRESFSSVLNKIKNERKRDERKINTEFSDNYFGWQNAYPKKDSPRMTVLQTQLEWNL